MLLNDQTEDTAFVCPSAPVQNDNAVTVNNTDMNILRFIMRN